MSGRKRRQHRPNIAAGLAVKIVRWAARIRYGSGTSRADVRAEEWTALVQARQGTLLKLSTAVGFATAAAGHHMVRGVRDDMSQRRRLTVIAPHAPDRHANW